jgi:putative salt-induced outer membrane protein
MLKHALLSAVALTLTAAPSVLAQTIELPAALKKLIETAATLEDGKHFESVVAAAMAAAPEHHDAIAALAETLRADIAPPAEAAAQVAAAAEEAPPAKPTSFFDFKGWEGEIELSGNRSTGNTKETGLGLAGKALVDLGEWRHKFGGLVEFQRSAGTTTKQRFLATYDINYELSARSYVFGMMQYEDDRFGGFEYRFSETAGLGYMVLDNDTFRWSLEAGPGARHTKLEAQSLDTEFVGFGRSDFLWRFSDHSELSHVLGVFVGSDRTSLDTTLALKMRINGALSARLSYNYRYNSNVPVGNLRTDTLTKAALVYDF